MSHACPHCQKTFSRSTFVTRHVKSAHSEEKGFRCCACDAAFARSDVLKRHENLCKEGKLAYRGSKRRKTDNVVEKQEPLQTSPISIESPPWSADLPVPSPYNSSNDSPVVQLEDGSGVHADVLHFMRFSGSSFEQPFLSSNTSSDSSLVQAPSISTPFDSPFSSFLSSTTVDSPEIDPDLLQGESAATLTKFNWAATPDFQRAHQLVYSPVSEEDQEIETETNGIKCQPGYGLTPGDAEIPPVDLSTYDGAFFAGPMRIIEGFRSFKTDGASFIPSPTMLRLLSSKAASTGTKTCLAIHLPTFVWVQETAFLGFSLGLLPALSSKEPELQAFTTGALAIKRSRYYESFTSTFQVSGDPETDKARLEELMEEPQTMRKLDTFLRCFIVYHLAGMSSSTSLQRELANAWQERFVRFARTLNLFGRAKSQLPLPMQDLQLAWHVWVDDETKRRAAFSIFLSDITSCARQMIFMTNVDLEKDMLDIPMPSTNAAWSARYAQEWAICQVAYGKSPTLGQVLRHLFGCNSAASPDAEDSVKNWVVGEYAAQIIGSLFAFGLVMLEPWNKKPAWDGGEYRVTHHPLTQRSRRFLQAMGIKSDPSMSEAELRKSGISQIRLAQLKFGGLRFEDVSAIAASSDCSMADGQETWLKDLAELTLGIGGS